MSWNPWNWWIRFDDWILGLFDALVLWLWNTWGWPWRSFVRGTFLGFVFGQFVLSVLGHEKMLVSVVLSVLCLAIWFFQELFYGSLPNDKLALIVRRAREGWFSRAWSVYLTANVIIVALSWKLAPVHRPPILPLANTLTLIFWYVQRSIIPTGKRAPKKTKVRARLGVAVYE